MRIDIYYHDDRETKEILLRLENKMTVIADAVSALETKVAAQDSVVSSVVTLLQEITQMLKDALANPGNDPALVARVQAVVDHIDANDATLANAVVSNTPADQPAPPVEPPVDAPVTDVPTP
jgi:phosphoglycerate dehydrogenase-like enzyme